MTVANKTVHQHVHIVVLLQVWQIRVEEKNLIELSLLPSNGACVKESQKNVSVKAIALWTA